VTALAPERLAQVAPRPSSTPAANRPAPETTSPRSAHRADVQGLRALAVLLVALAHARVGLVAGGFVGVDVFFVLSGFLITGLLLAEARKTGTISLLDFYVRRARRILPAAALTLVATDLASLYVLNFVRARTAVGDSVHAAAFSANFRFAARGVDYFAQADPPSPFLHFWSLSVEEQFYFVWPLVLVAALFGTAVARRRAALPQHRRVLVVVVALAGCSLAWSVHETASVPAPAYFSPFTRAWELGLGAAVAVGAPTLAQVPARARLVLGWAGLAAIAAAALAFSAATPFPGCAALLPTLGAACAIVAGMGNGSSRFGAGRLLALRPLTYMGDRSYALYLWHWPVLVLASEYVGRAVPAAENVGLVAAAFLLSCASYALVEDPIRRRMNSPMRTAVVTVVCLAAVLATATLSFAAIDRTQHRFEGTAAAPRSTLGYRALGSQGALPAVVAAVEAAESGAPLPTGLTPRLGELRNFPPPYKLADGCIARDRQSGTTSRVCRVGRPSSRRVVVLIGDSHALMWLPSLLEMAWQDNWAVVPLLRLGCTPGRWVSTHDTSCRAWYRWALGQVARLHPEVTLIGGSVDQRETPETRKAIIGLVGAARTLKTRGRVVVIGDPEGLTRDPVDCLLSSNATMANCTATWPDSALAPYDRVARETKALGVRFLPTRGFVCFDHRCPTVIGNTIAWMDTNHMTVAYAVQIADAFRTSFRRQLAQG
jgi:peptidoglycan/LPS O-acetylase OafA/YrhL